MLGLRAGVRRNSCINMCRSEKPQAPSDDWAPHQHRHASETPKRRKALRFSDLRFGHAFRVTALAGIENSKGGKG